MRSIKRALYLSFNSPRNSVFIRIVILSFDNQCRQLVCRGKHDPSTGNIGFKEAALSVCTCVHSVHVSWRALVCHTSRRFDCPSLLEDLEDIPLN